MKLKCPRRDAWHFLVGPRCRRVCVCVSWQMSAVGITENVKGDVKKFEIWYSGREEVYLVQVRTTSTLWNDC